jgi:hypothetical protein
VTHEELEACLRRVSGVDVRITALHAATRWSDHARTASSYRRGRVLLAGDAAHVHPPFGGQGLNLGILDALNLGWKLAATLSGRASAELLDTYSSERRPEALRVAQNTRAQLALMRPDPQTTALRQLIAGLLETQPDLNRALIDMMSAVNLRYDLGDDDPLVGTFATDPAMQDGRGLLVDGEEGALSDVAAPWSAAVRIVRGPRSMLVRPDGCIAWAGRAGGLRPALARWFGDR